MHCPGEPQKCKQDEQGDEGIYGGIPRDDLPSACLEVRGSHLDAFLFLASGYFERGNLVRPIVNRQKLGFSPS